MRVHELLAGAAAIALLVGGCASEAPSWVRSGTARYGAPVALPTPTTVGGMSLDQAIAQRRSSRAFRPEPLPMATLSR